MTHTRNRQWQVNPGRDQLPAASFVLAPYAANSTCCCCLCYTIGFPPSVSRLAAVILPLSLYTLLMYIATLRSAAVSPSPLVGAPLWVGGFWGLGGGLGACTAGGGPGGGLGACTAGKGGHIRGGCCGRGGVRARGPALAGCGGPGGDPGGLRLEQRAALQGMGLGKAIPVMLIQQQDKIR